MNRLASLLFCVLFSIGPVAEAVADPYRTDQPVEFELQRLGGGSVTSGAFRGQWIVLNYWATWCAPCRKEIPELIELHGAREDITVLGLAYEEADEDAFEAFLEAFEPNYPIVLVDVANPPEPFGAPRVLPTTIILDPAGRAVGGFAGPVTRASLEDYIDAIPSP
jgi:thiol-disulfide isomerase/thioredoxin